MIIANLKDGDSRHFDPTIKSKFLELRDLLSTGKVTALSLLHQGFSCCLPLPKKFYRKPIYGAELLIDKNNKPIGERVFVQVDKSRISLTITFKSKLCRCDVINTGIMKYHPMNF